MDSRKPLYRHSLKEAVRHEEKDLWRESYKINCDCARAIERIIAENYDGKKLGPDLAEPIIQQAIEQNPKIDIIRSHVPVEILEQEGKVGGIVLKNVHDGQRMKLETKAVFPYIGADPCTEFAQDLGILDERGYILVNNNMETARAGIYGVGDVTAKTLRQVVTAANDGAIAAQQAFHQIKE